MGHNMIPDPIRVRAHPVTQGFMLDTMWYLASFLFSCSTSVNAIPRGCPAAVCLPVCAPPRTLVDLNSTASSAHCRNCMATRGRLECSHAVRRPWPDRWRQAVHTAIASLDPSLFTTTKTFNDHTELNEALQFDYRKVWFLGQKDLPTLDTAKAHVPKLLLTILPCKRYALLVQSSQLASHTICLAIQAIFFVNLNWHSGNRRPMPNCYSPPSALLSLFIEVLYE